MEPGSVLATTLELLPMSPGTLTQRGCGPFGMAGLGMNCGKKLKETTLPTGTRDPAAGCWWVTTGRVVYPQGSLVAANVARSPVS